MAYHDNLYGTHKSYVPILVNFGWNAPKLEKMIGKPIYRFTYYDGFHMAEKAIKQFNATNPYGVAISQDDVSAMWNDNSVTNWKW